MRHYFLLCLSFFGCCFLYAKENPQYRYSDIPNFLLQNANSVVRLNEQNVTVKSMNEMILKERWAVTILNEQGYEQAELQEDYFKYNKIRHISFALFDSSGKLIKKANEADVADKAQYEDSYFTDARTKKYNFHYSNFPFTVELEIERKISSLFFTPDWSLIDDYNSSLEKGSCSIEYPSYLNLRYKLHNVNFSVSKQMIEGKNVLSIKAQNISAIKKDPLLYNKYTLPLVEFVFDSVIIDKYKGSMSSWQSAGKFVYELNKERDLLPDNIKDTLVKLTENSKTEYDKISKLYDYLKTHTRYVSIQLGIGGWQTFDAMYVSRNGYGDCKALSNYMMSMLKAVNIKAYTALVYAGEEDYYPLQYDFPSNVFNHVILCVPTKEDSVWIECTAKDLPAGYLSAFTSNRDVLLITEDGGSVVHTPVYDYRDNMLSRNATIAIDLQKNNFKSDIAIEYSGSYFDDKKNTHYQPVRDQQKYLAKIISLPQFTVKDNTVTEGVVNKIPHIKEEISLEGTGIFTIVNDKLFIQPFFSVPKNDELILDEQRNKPYRLQKSFSINDTITIHTPDGYSLDTKPESIILSYPFGVYNCTYTYASNKLYVVKQYKQFEGIYGRETYSDYLKLINIANNKYNYSRAVFIKK